MLKLTRSAALAASTVLGALAAFSVTAAEPGKGVTVSDSIEAQATVQAIDMSTRTVTLKAENGDITNIEVPPEVAKLDQLKVGDVVMANYTVALAAKIAKPGDPVASASAAVSRPEAGQSGPISASRQVTARVTVNAVDTAANTVTITGPKGNMRTIAVRNPDVQQRLKNLKAGDQVDITYTEALALSLKPRATQ